jgi:hypothetical protein
MPLFDAGQLVRPSLRLVVDLVQRSRFAVLDVELGLRAVLRDRRRQLGRLDLHRQLGFLLNELLLQRHIVSSEVSMHSRCDHLLDMLPIDHYERGRF